ncbi:MAG: hypothetical protein ACP5QG_04995 [candidate division WOR-3 bacterium]
MPAYEKLETALIRALSLLEGNRYTGYDPYDGLLSPIARILPGARARLIFIHGVRKKPFNIRPLLGIKKTMNPKTLALCLSAYAIINKMKIRPEVSRGERLLLQKVVDVVSLLDESFPWGYPFPWQSRAFFVPQGTPTAVNTAFVIHALADTAESFELKTAGLVKKGAANILKCLNRSHDGFFSYTPLDNYRIHNANLLLASALARAGFADEAMEAARASIALQRLDGSWPYGEDHEMFSYIDNFHTGFVILALISLKKTFGDEFGEPLEKVVDFYKRNLFGSDGLPLWRIDRRYPLDVHTFAVAAGTMAELGETQKALKLADALIHLFMNREGRFGYQRGRFIYNRTNYARWGQAWGVWALAKVLLAS